MTHRSFLRGLVASVSLVLVSGVGAAPVQTESGAVEGITLPGGIRAWMGVRIDGNQTRAVVASLLGEPGVESLHDTNGRWDLLAELRAENMTALSQVLERVRLTKGIAHTETSILLATFR